MIKGNLPTKIGFGVGKYQYSTTIFTPQPPKTY